MRLHGQGTPQAGCPNERKSNSSAAAEEQGPTHTGAPDREGGRASDQGRESSWLGDDPLQKLVLVSGQLIEKFIPALLPTELVTMPPVANEPELGCPTVGATSFPL